MLQGFLVGAAFLSGELAGAFVQLRGHFGGFFSGTAERDEDFGEFGYFHGTNLTTDSHGFTRKKRRHCAHNQKSVSIRPHPWFKDYFAASPGTILMLTTPTRLSGRSCGCVGVHRDFPVEAHARGAFVSEEKDLIPEGLAYDARRNVFYLSSLLRRKIVKISAEGEFSEFVPAGRDRLLPILGIRVDPNDGTVWADSWDDAVDRSELLHFDGSGNLLGRFAPHDAAKHGFNDLVVMKSGMVFLTDSVSNQVFRFDPKAHAFNAVAIYRELSEPNGIAVSDDEQQMFVADDFGVVKVELRDGKSAEVDAGGHNTLAGIDGLYWYKGSLIGVQNGVGSPRIAVFRLSADGARVTKATVLENRSVYMDQPTTGAIRGDSFYFIVNSQGGNLNGDHVLDVTTLARVRIAVVRLP